MLIMPLGQPMKIEKNFNSAIRMMPSHGSTLNFSKLRQLPTRSFLADLLLFHSTKTSFYVI